MNKVVYLETWTESEAGWGTRPDGVTLHLNKSDYELYVKQYWEKEKERNPSGKTPEEYTRQDNNLQLAMVSDKIYNEVSKTECGLRFWNHEFNKLAQSKDIKFIERHKNS